MITRIVESGLVLVLDPCILVHVDYMSLPTCLSHTRRARHDQTSSVPCSVARCCHLLGHVRLKILMPTTSLNPSPVLVKDWHVLAPNTKVVSSRMSHHSPD